MGGKLFNLTESEKQAIKSIDESELHRLISVALDREQLGELNQMPLNECGLFVSRVVHRFGAKLAEYRASKAAKKRDRTLYDARRVGNELSSAVAQMKTRVKEEEKDAQYFHIEERPYWPTRFSRNLGVTVSYRWREKSNDEWHYGSIAFIHKASEKLGDWRDRYTRKPSAARREEMLQDELSQIWEALRMQAHYSVRDFFRAGGDGNQIPETFNVKTDPPSFSLNNHSCKFW